MGMRTLRSTLLALTAVAAVSFAYPAKANLIQNGGFENGEAFWTFFGGSVQGTFNGVPPHSGSLQAVLGNDFVQQMLTLAVGTTYHVEFFLAATNFTQPGVVHVAVQGMANQVIAIGGNQSYTEYSFDFTATQSSGFLQFFPVIDINSSILLDDVSVEPAGVGVPDGGTTVSLLGCALVGLAGLRRRLGC